MVAAGCGVVERKGFAGAFVAMLASAGAAGLVVLSASTKDASALVPPYPNRLGEGDDEGCLVV